MKKVFAICIGIWFFIGVCFSLERQIIPEEERRALIELYTALKGRVPQDNWVSFGQPGTESAWAGVTVENGHVIDLRMMVENNVKIPKCIGDLQCLENLELQGDGHGHLIGEIPPELWGLTSLKSLDLSNNGLIGEIPLEITNLFDLRNLALRNNSFAGSIMPSICKLLKLESVWIGGNKFTGNIPREIIYLNSLECFSVSYNKFIGEVPPELLLLDNLKNVDLSNNGFTGNFSWHVVSRIEKLDLSGNEYLYAKIDTAYMPFLKHADIAGTKNSVVILSNSFYTWTIFDHTKSLYRD